MSMKIPLLDLKAQYATIKDEVLAKVNDVFDKQTFILGENVKEFEKEIAAYLGTKNAVGVASGTDALLIALMGLGIGEGDEVITTPFTFIATGEVIARAGAKPIFVDIEDETYNMDPNLLEKAISDKTKAIIAVHIYGHPTDMGRISRIASGRNIPVIEDCAQAMGAVHGDKKVGTIGEVGCFSFFPSKNLGGFGDGGLVVTEDKELADKFRMIRVHGSREKYYHPIRGLNSRLDEIQACVLRVKLKYLDGWNDKRIEKAAYYSENLKGLEQIKIPVTGNGNKHVFHLYMVGIENAPEAKKFFDKKGIGTGFYYPVSLHLQECFKHLGYKKGDFPKSEKSGECNMALPIYAEITNQQQDYVIQAVKEFDRLRSRAVS